jgi:uncharacterized protein YcbX
MPRLARITIYPIKALDGLDVGEARVLPAGSLEYDRRLAIVDAEGKVFNGKRTDRVHAIRAGYDLERGVVTLRLQGRDPARSFALDDLDGLAGWFSHHFEQPVRVVENAAAGWPDDTDSPGPTVIGTATLEAVAGWFPGVALAGARRRFRANLEIGDAEPFWEDRLYDAPDRAVAFRVGGVGFEGTNPCQRCVVPTRSPDTAEVIPGFQKTFAENRRSALPPWAYAGRFNHFYRLAVNTRLGRSDPGVIRVGDPVEVQDATSTLRDR